MLAEPVICTVSVCRWLTARVAVKGVTLTLTCGDVAVMVTAREAVFEESAAGIADNETILGEGAVAGVEKTATLVPEGP